MDNDKHTEKKIETSKEVFYYLVRNYPVENIKVLNKDCLKIVNCPFFLHESKRRIKDHLFEKLKDKLPDHFKTEDQKKEVYMTIKNYIDQTRQLNKIQ